MKRLLIIAALALLCAASVAAQSVVIGQGATSFDERTYANRPTNVPAGYVYVLTDASSAGSCAAGGGSARSLCRWTGAAWESLGGAGGSGTPGGSDTQVQFNDGGSFGGNSGLTFDKTTGTLNATVLTQASNAVETQNNKGAADGYAPLDGSSKLAAGYLPSTAFITNPSAAVTTQPTADAAIIWKCFNGTNTANNTEWRDQTDAVIMSIACDGTFTVGGSGAGFWQFTTGAMDVGDASTVKIGAHTGNVLSVSENGGAVTPVIIGTRLTTNGDLFYHNGTIPTRLPRGADTECLTSTATSIAWATCPGGSGDSVQIAGNAVNTTINFTNVTGDGTVPGYSWTYGAGSPDTGTFTMVPASATAAGVVTTGTQSFAGAKTFNSSPTAPGYSMTSGGQRFIAAGGLGDGIGLRGADSSSTNSTGTTLTRGGEYTGTGNFNSAPTVIRGGNNGTTGTGNAGALTANGGDQTAAATGGVAGKGTFRGGNTAGDGTPGDGEFAGGISTDATPPAPGKLMLVQGWINGSGTTTANAVQCPVAAAVLNVDDCPTSAVNWVGVALDTGNTVRVQVGGVVTVTYDGTYSPSAGWFACTSASVAGQVTPQSGACSAGRQVGIVAENGSSVTSGRIQIQKD